MKTLIAIFLVIMLHHSFAQKGLQINSGYLKIHSGSYVKVTNSDGNCTVGASGTLENGGTLSAAGDWTNNGTFNATTGVFSCSGNYTSNGTQNESTSSVELNGSSAQTLSGTDLTFHDLVVNNSSGDVNLLDDASINGTITLTNGDLIIADTKTLSIDDTDDPGISGGSASAHIVTNGSAVIEDTYSSTTEITYPLGNGTNYRPVSLTPTNTTAETWTVSYTSSAFGDLDVDASGLDHVSSQEYWSVNRSGTVDATLKFTWAATNGVDDYTNLSLAHYDGSTDWDNLASTPVGNNTSGTITTDAAVSSFSPFTLGSLTADNPLPIELISFKGVYSAEKDEVILSWTTASELNNDYFTLERSFTADDWHFIAEIPGAGSCHRQSNYQYIDNVFQNGTVYYRLKQTDFDGQSTDVSPIAVYISKSLTLFPECEIFPNPAESYICVDFASEGQVELMNTMGVVVLQEKLGPNTKIDLLSYAKGLYFLTVTNGNSVCHKRFLLR